jgi:molybdopterin converting factor small subunit
MPTILVTLPTPLHRAAGGVGELAAEGETVALALASLRDGHPAVARLFLEESNEPRRGVSLFLNGSDLRSLAGLGTPLKPADRLAVVLLVSGG